jgi:hypothetical protein
MDQPIATKVQTKYNTKKLWQNVPLIAITIHLVARTHILQQNINIITTQLNCGNIIN